jgi:hypothetical protein
MAYAVSLTGRRCIGGVEVGEGAHFRLARLTEEVAAARAELEALCGEPAAAVAEQPIGILGAPHSGGDLGEWPLGVDGDFPSLLTDSAPGQAVMPGLDQWHDMRECVRYKTRNMETFRRTLEGAASALAVKFAMCKTDDALLAFMDRWGIPGLAIDPAGEPDDVEVPMVAVRFRRDYVRQALDYHRTGDKRADDVLSAGWGAQNDLRPSLSRPRAAKKPVLLLETRNLAGFMALELGAMIAGGAKVMRCDHCSTIYATGDYEGRHRRAGRFCSNRCRVADQRARAKGSARKRGDS